MDGSSIDGFNRSTTSDQSLYSRHWIPLSFCLASAAAQRARARPSATCTTHGTPFVGDPRVVLKKMLKKAEDMGYTFNVGPELESSSSRRTKRAPPPRRATRPAIRPEPLDHGENTRREICLALEDMGFEIEASHHEVAQGQHEIDSNMPDALTTADNIMTFKYVVKTLAQKSGLHATSCPSPLRHQTAPACIRTCPVQGTARTRSTMKPARLGLSENAYHFIAGLLEHVRGMAVLHDTRWCTPISVWSPAMRLPATWPGRRQPLGTDPIPSARGSSTRLELRLPRPELQSLSGPGPSACPRSGRHWRKLTPPAEITGTIFHMDCAARERKTACEPAGSLAEAIETFKQDPLLMETLGAHICEQYLEGKEKEWDEFRTSVSATGIIKKVHGNFLESWLCA